MSLREKNNARRNRINLYLGIFLVFIMGFSAIAPLLQSNQTQEILPTPTTAPARPTPIQDLNNISYDTVRQHRTGLFSVAVPAGWESATDTNNSTEAQTSFRNTSAQSVIETRVISPITPIETPEDLKAIFTPDWLRSSWRDYTTYNQVSEKIENDTLILDFTLARGTQDYIARHVAYTDGDWVYVVRVITPPNANEMALSLLENVKASFTPNKALYGTSFEWNGYYDSSTQTLVRYPLTWQLLDSGTGAPASLSGDGATLRVETVNATVTDEASAQAWVESAVNGAVVTSTTPVERYGVSGFQVAYTFTNLDGDSESGFAVIYPNGEGKVSVANLRIPQASVDLEDVVNANFKAILGEFGVLAQ